MILPGFPRSLPMVGGFDPNTPLGTFVEDQGGYYIGTILDGGVTFALFLGNKASGQNNSIQWKTASTATAGTSSLTNGLANSNAMNDASHPAAQFCRSVTIGGYSDWYLPAKDELNIIYSNRTVISGGDAIDVDWDFYWSSTESAVANAWAQRFIDDLKFEAGKVNSLRVRVIRRVPL